MLIIKGRKEYERLRETCPNIVAVLNHYLYLISGMGLSDVQRRLTDYQYELFMLHFRISLCTILLSQ